MYRLLTSEGKLFGIGTTCTVPSTLSALLKQQKSISQAGFYNPALFQTSPGLQGATRRLGH